MPLQGIINVKLGDNNDLSSQPSIAFSGLVPENTTSGELIEDLLFHFYTLWTSFLPSP